MSSDWKAAVSHLHARYPMSVDSDLFEGSRVHGSDPPAGRLSFAQQPPGSRLKLNWRVIPPID